MAAITANINSSVGWVPLSEADAIALEGGLYTIGSETIEVGGPHRLNGRTTSPFNGRWVTRGLYGSTAASHLSGVTLTRYYADAPAAGDGGGIPQGGPYTGTLEAEDAAARVGNTAPMLLAEGQEPLPTIISDVDPMTIPALAAQVVVGTTWVNTAVPAIQPFPTFVAVFEDDEFDSWAASGLTHVTDVNNYVRISVSDDSIDMVVMVADSSVGLVQISDGGVSITGAAGQQITFGAQTIIAGLPTEDPEVEGALFITAGALMVSAGPV